MTTTTHTAMWPHPAGVTHDWVETDCTCIIGEDHDGGQEA